VPLSLKRSLVLLALTASAGVASAQSLNNGSFEAATMSADYCYTYNMGCSLSNWTSSTALILAGSSAWGAPNLLPNSGLIDGGKVVGLQNQSYVAQSLSLAGGTYLVSWVDAGRAGYDSQDYTVSLGVQSSTPFGTVSGQGWAQRSATFTLASAATLDLRFAGNRNTGDGTAFIDNVTISAVPEPQSVALMAAGLLAMAFMRRKGRPNA
jgi:PEP-CTERM motif